MRGLARARSFRPPTPAERHDPRLGQIYAVEHQLHRERWLSRQAEHEAMRFSRDAVSTEDPVRRALLERSAAAHHGIAAQHAKKVRGLTRQRGQLLWGPPAPKATSRERP